MAKKILVMVASKNEGMIEGSDSEHLMVKRHRQVESIDNGTIAGEMSFYGETPPAKFGNQSIGRECRPLHTRGFRGKNPDEPSFLMTPSPRATFLVHRPGGGDPVLSL